MRKKIFALLFLAGVFGYAGLNFWYGGDTWVETVEESLADGIELQTAPQTISETVSALDASIIDSMYGRMEFIETYSYIQVLLDKREFNNFSYISDEDGYLHYASFFREDTNDAEEYARRLRRLQDCVEPNGTKVLFFCDAGEICAW